MDTDTDTHSCASTDTHARTHTQTLSKHARATFVIIDPALQNRGSRQLWGDCGTALSSWPGLSGARGGSLGLPELSGAFCGSLEALVGLSGAHAGLSGALERLGIVPGVSIEFQPSSQTLHGSRACTMQWAIRFRPVSAAFRLSLQSDEQKPQNGVQTFGV
eukprot:6057364-Alexandrium_andersonii.AAC.2